MKLTKPNAVFSPFERAVYRAAIHTLEAQFPAVKRVLRGRLPDDIAIADEPGELPAVVVTVGGEQHRLPIY